MVAHEAYGYTGFDWKWSDEAARERKVDVFCRYQWWPVDSEDCKNVLNQGLSGVERPFSHKNQGQYGQVILSPYPENLKCHHEIVTDCDPDTQQIAVEITKLAIVGGDNECSADYAQFSASGGFEGLGITSSSQVMVQKVQHINSK